MKKLLALVLSLGMMFSLAACGGGEEAAEGGDAPAEGALKVGYSINSMNDTWQTYLAAAVEEGVKAKGMEFELQDAQEDAIKQQDQINAMIANGINALVVIAVDTSAAEPIIKAADDAGIPLLFVNRNPFGEEAPPANVFYTGVDEPIAGQMQAEYLATISDGGNVGILQGLLSNDAAIKRTAGFGDALGEEFTIVATEVADWQRDKAITVVENMLTAYGDDLNVIVANNDEMALGAVNALEKAGRDDILVLGVDGTPDGLAAIKDGGLACSVFQSAPLMGEQAVTIIDNALNGVEQDAVQHVDWSLITPENVDEF